MKRPRILEGKTVVVKTGLGKVYITVNELDSKPFEVFATIGKSGKSIQAKTEAIGRLVSLNLKNDVKVENIIKQLEGITGENPTQDGMLPAEDKLILSIPDAIAKILKEFYCDRNNES